MSRSALLAAACVTGVVLLAGPRRGRARARLERVVPAPAARAETVSARAAPRSSRGVRVSALLAGLAVWQLVGGRAGMVVGGLAALALVRWLRGLEPADVRAERGRLLADLPVTLDLLAGCVGAGASPQQALTEVGDGVGGPLGLRLVSVAAQLRLGADPSVAWAELSDVAALAPVVRSITRSLDSGAAWAPTLERAARDLRVRRRVAGEAAARAVAVKAVAPLGACFLPAFVLLGVVPTIWGIAAATFTGGL